MSVTPPSHPTTRILAMNQLQSCQSALLEKIDEVHSIGVGGPVELPQIIVCGDQSSGKSSVLRAISGLGFNFEGNGRTRFATELVMRRSPHKRSKVSIVPGASRTDENERKKLRGFPCTSLPSKYRLPALLRDAEQYMGLAHSNPANFDVSDDVLRVEISGPDEPDLTLIDLPGLYTTKDESKGGTEKVRRLSETYMENSQSIILAIVNAGVDYHIQDVLNIAARFDPECERTMGIVTHLELLEIGSDAEQSYLQLIKNEKTMLKLGWHVLRNQSFGAGDESVDDRDAEENNFFEQGPWFSLSREQVGIEALRHRLSKSIFNHVKRTLPDLLRGLQERISQNEQALAKMGKSRTALQDQQRFLLDISSAFSCIINQALNGSYVHDFFGRFKGNATESKDFHMRRLRAFVRDLNEYFADAMCIRGCRRTILGHHHNPRSTFDSDNPYMVGWEQHIISYNGLEEEIMSQARQSRGIELPGAANQLLVGDLFRDQSEPWEEIAKAHLINTWTSVEYFTHLVLDYLTDESVHALLMEHLIAPQLEKLKLALLEKLEELTSYPKSGHPLPIGKSFLSKIQTSRGERQLFALRKTLPLNVQYTADEMKSAVSHLQSHCSDRYAAEDIIDQMEKYYDTAIVTFVDNVAILAIENCLLRPLETILTSQTVIDMEPEQIEKIAGEPDDTRRERLRLTEEIEKLREAKETLSGFNTPAAGARTFPMMGDLSTIAKPPRGPFSPWNYNLGNPTWLYQRSQARNKMAEPDEDTDKPSPVPKVNLPSSGTSKNTTSDSAANTPFTTTAHAFGQPTTPSSNDTFYDRIQSARALVPASVRERFRNDGQPQQHK